MIMRESIYERAMANVAGKKKLQKKGKAYVHAN